MGRKLSGIEVHSFVWHAALPSTYAMECNNMMRPMPNRETTCPANTRLLDVLVLKKAGWRFL